MSTNRSVGRLTAAQAKGRFTATREKGRSASTQEKVRSAATNKVGHFTATSKKDRSRLCAFTFADGRQCRTPRCSGHLHLCYFHAQKEAESLAAQQVGQDISRFLPVKLLTACDLGVAMSRLFCAVAQGQVKPKVAGTLAYLAQTMLQSIPIAQDEYIQSFDTNAWRREIRSSFNVPAPQPAPAPHPRSQPAPKPPASASAPPTPLEAGPVYPEPRSEPGSSASASFSSTSSPAPQPPAQPAPSPHTPLPPTSTEFLQQVLAGLFLFSRPFLQLCPSPHALCATRTFIAQHTAHSDQLATCAHSARPAAHLTTAIPANSGLAAQLATCTSAAHSRLCHPALVPPPTGTS